MPENESAVAFVSSYLQRKTDVMGTGFMMRAADYHKLGGIPLYPNLLFADFELWIRLTELNYKATAANNAFSFRLHQSTTSISPDVKFQQAFSRFIGFLESLAAKSAVFKNAITQHGAGYLLYYCQALSHRLLRSPASKRHGLTVARVVADCIEYAKRLDLPGTFDPRSRASIRMALMLDSNPVTRSIFLGFKKIYSKPLLR
jgi:hypothetical protein